MVETTAGGILMGIGLVMIVTGLIRLFSDHE